MSTTIYFSERFYTSLPSEVKFNRLLTSISETTKCEIKLSKQRPFKSVSGLNVNYFDYNSKQKFTGNRGEQSFTDSGKWAKEGRKQFSLHKLCNEVILNFDLQSPFYSIYVFLEGAPCITGLSDDDRLKIQSFACDELVTAFNTISEQSSDVIISDELNKVYNLPHEGFSSCMKNCFYHDQLEEGGVKIAYIEKEGKLYARCLIWEGAIIHGERVNLFDRIYGADGYKNILENYLVDLDYISASTHKEVTFNISLDPDRNLPYMDNLMYYSGLKLSNKNRNTLFILQDTNGGVQYMNECESCSCSINDEEAHNVNGTLYCCDCVTLCYYCDEYVPNDETRYSNLLDRSYCDDCTCTHRETLIERD